ncbi:MAG TPA: phosphate ABC transporter substrate-binding protein PstS [Thermodesulfovibrionales bacterium]|jgi:phosphate transport system substrate-binding protein|nr:phosphate ABC transporter substrate-binding protein PstS [Thermodesulfovibrionales bacterium]
MKVFLKMVFVLAVVLSFTSVNAAETLNGAGASFPYPVYSAWAFDYNKVAGVQLNYQSIGSGGGIKQITARTVDFGASDAPLTTEELNKDGLLQFPAVMGGVVPVVAIPGVKEGQLRLDSDAICKIYLGDIKHWDDSKIKSLNPGLNLAHDEITVVHRSDGSGTTAIFTTYLSELCPDWKDKVGAGTSVKWPVGIGGKGNEGVANYTKRTPNSIGYVEFAYAEQNKLAYVLLKNPAGNFVEPNFKTFEDAAATANFDPKKHFHLWLVNAPGKNAWPIAGATFILLAKEKTDSNKKVVAFYDWAFKNGDKKANELVYVPLPASLKDKIRAYWKANGLQ